MRMTMMTVMKPIYVGFISVSRITRKSVRLSKILGGKMLTTTYLSRQTHKCSLVRYCLRSTCSSRYRLSVALVWWDDCVSGDRVSFQSLYRVANRHNWSCGRYVAKRRIAVVWDSAKNIPGYFFKKGFVHKITFSMIQTKLMAEPMSTCSSPEPKINASGTTTCRFTKCDMMPVAVDICKEREKNWHIFAYLAGKF